MGQKYRMFFWFSNHYEIRGIVGSSGHDDTNINKRKSEIVD